MNKVRRLIFAASFAFLPIIARALTLSDIETRVRRNVSDTQSTDSLKRYTDAMLTDWANEAQKEFVNLTWCVQTSTSYALTAATTFYALPTNFLAESYATFTDQSGNTIRLLEYSEKKVYDQEPGFEGSGQGTPDHFYLRFPGNASASPQIAYIPVPTTSSTGTVKLWYFYSPADLSGSSDVPFDGYRTLYQYHNAIVSHVTARIKAIEGKYDEAKIYYAEFQQYVAEALNRIRSLPGYSPNVQAAPR